MPDTLFPNPPVPMDFGDVKPLAHADGPSTSHEAAARHTESGDRFTNCRRAECLVRSYSGGTSAELWDIYCAWNLPKVRVLDLTELRRRLTDLKNQGRIVQGDKRRCRVAKTQAVTWEVV